VGGDGGSADGPGRRYAGVQAAPLIAARQKTPSCPFEWTRGNKCMKCRRISRFFASMALAPGLQLSPA
jgi:hypothetical protein